MEEIHYNPIFNLQDKQTGKIHNLKFTEVIRYDNKIYEQVQRGKFIHKKQHLLWK